MIIMNVDALVVKIRNENKAIKRLEADINGHYTERSRLLDVLKGFMEE